MVYTSTPNFAIFVSSVQKSECQEGYLSEKGAVYSVSSYIAIVSTFNLTIALVLSAHLNDKSAVNFKIGIAQRSILYLMPGRGKLVAEKSLPYSSCLRFYGTHDI